ncbi:MAG: hypothetical protein IJO40_04310 [Thermoguttaceae bacterium]|nr:hypothetical protein [Thermoguttaceae bacterium]
MFDYTNALSVVCRDICAKTPIFQKYDLDYVGFACRRTRNNELHGVFASLTPLLFEGGGLATYRRGSYWKAPDVVADGRKLLYVLTVYVPRFLDLPLNEKIRTLTHELYHISPDFNGDVRRFPGKNYAHGASREKYDAVVAQYADAWLARDPDPRIWGFLQYDAVGLTRRFGKVSYRRFRTVKLIRIEREEATRLNPALAPPTSSQAKRKK